MFEEGVDLNDREASMEIREAFVEEDELLDLEKSLDPEHPAHHVANREPGVASAGLHAGAATAPLFAVRKAAGSELVAAALSPKAQRNSYHTVACDCDWGDRAPALFNYDRFVTVGFRQYGATV